MILSILAMLCMASIFVVLAFLWSFSPILAVVAAACVLLLLGGKAELR